MSELSIEELKKSMNKFSVEELKKRIDEIEEILKELEPPHDGDEYFYLGLVEADYSLRLQAYKEQRKYWEIELKALKEVLISKENK